MTIFDVQGPFMKMSGLKQLLFFNAKFISTDEIWLKMKKLNLTEGCMRHCKCTIEIWHLKLDILYIQNVQKM